MSDNLNLPPLPEPAIPVVYAPAGGYAPTPQRSQMMTIAMPQPYFTASQVDAYARTAILADRAARAVNQVPAGWLSVDDARPKFVGEDDTPVWTWDGHQVREDEYGLEWDQPAGPVIGGWVVTGEGFQGDTLGSVTHWMPRTAPAAPIATDQVAPEVAEAGQVEASEAWTRAMNAALTYRNADPEAIDEQDAWVNLIDAIKSLAATPASPQAPAPQAVVGEASEQPDWPKSWLRDGFNGCVLSAIAALQYLANNDRPVGGSSSFNSEHLFMIASELAVTRERLLTPPAPSAARSPSVDAVPGEPVAETDGDTTSKAQYRRMFNAACEALGLINEALGLDPDDGGAEPILDAITELKSAALTPSPAPSAAPGATSARPDCAGYFKLGKKGWEQVNPGDWILPGVVPLFKKPTTPATHQGADALREAHTHAKKWRDWEAAQHQAPQQGEQHE